MSFIKKSLQHEKELLQVNKEAVIKMNNKMFVVVFGVAAFCYTFAIGISFTAEAYSPLRNVYVVSLLILGIMFSIVKYFKLLEKTRAPFYLTYIFIILIAAYSSAFITPDYIGVIVLICLFEVPVFILDKRINILIFEILAVVGYLSIVIPNKAAFLVQDELINVTIFAMIGIITGFFFQNIRLSNLDLLRRKEMDRIIDQTTDICNRRKLFEYFIEYEETQCKETPYAIAMVDIDSFKNFNDVYGHLAGDHCLAQVGKLFKDFGERNSIDFYRYGGEEFVGIIHKPPVGGLEALLDSLNKEVRELEIPHKKHDYGVVTVSIGAKLADDPKSVVNFEEAIAKADKAMYLAKASGKNRFVIFE